MGLSIKNDAVEAKVRRLARLLGLGVTEAIDLAVSDKLLREHRVSPEEQARRLEAAEAVLARFGGPWGLDVEAIETEMYDENGAPR